MSCYSFPLSLLLLLLSLPSIPSVSSTNDHRPNNKTLQPNSMNLSELETLFKIMDTMSSDHTWRLSYPDPCQTGGLSWPGIECKPGYDNLLHVTRLDFGTPPNPNCKPTATFPSLIFELPYLQSVFFFHCFTRTKTTLSVSPNRVINSSLQQLSLRSNPALIGPIPPQISSLKSLQILTLSQNSLSGLIPVEVFGLTFLVHLDLSYNFLMGTLPHKLGSLKNLIGLDLSYNALTGTIPATIGQLGMLQKLDLSSNSLFGAIPDTIENLNSLELCLSPSEAHSVNVGVGVCGNNQTGSLIHPLEKSQAPPCGFSRLHILFGALGFLALQLMRVSI
ncbi:receptor like protein 29 [Actinidia rufa]|uniref:Receptor like protein 29 n=1 Tax=Actinidia rufa TaxID=165716 RepID=A0A7J0DZ65_9ERIC|nr:receptor like protein 29 [Actinidia rufa]